MVEHLFASLRAERMAGERVVSFALTIRWSLIMSMTGITFVRLGVDQEKNRVASLST